MDLIPPPLLVEDLRSVVGILKFVYLGFHHLRDAGEYEEHVLNIERLVEERINAIILQLDLILLLPLADLVSLLNDLARV